MNWLRRIFTLPRSRNSFKDLVGLELWQQLDKDLDSLGAFAGACTHYIEQHPENAVAFARALGALMSDNARMVQRALDTVDPFALARANTRQFARNWGLEWD